MNNTLLRPKDTRNTKDTIAGTGMRRNMDNVFTYYTDWVGFNFPSRVFDHFYIGGFSPLSRRSKSFEIK